MPCSRSPGGVCSHGGCLVWGGLLLGGVPGQGYVCSQEGVGTWSRGEDSPGPHPRGKLRGIRSRPTPKGEIERDQMQAHTQGGN